MTTTISMLAGNVQYPPRRISVMSLNETGVARIMFARDLSRFDGALVNLQQEIYELHGTACGGGANSKASSCSPDSTTVAPLLARPVKSSTPPMNIQQQANNSLLTAIVDDDKQHGVDVNISPANSSPNFAQLTTTTDGSAADDRHFDLHITEGETGSQFTLKRVKLSVLVPSTDNASDPSLCQLDSDHVNFRTEEVLVGNRADLEARTYLTPELAGCGLPLHVGRMTINFRTTITPPPTPASSNADTMDGDSSAEPMDDAPHPQPIAHVPVPLSLPDDFMA